MQLKTRVRKWLQKIDTFREIVKSGFVWVPYPYSILCVDIPDNPDQTCGTEIQQNIGLLTLLGYIVTTNKVPCSTIHSAQLVQDLEQLANQAQRQRAQQYALKYRLANLL